MENMQQKLQGLCCVEISGESCANCLTLMPILKDICESRGDIKLVHVEADYSTIKKKKKWEVEKVPTILLMENGEIFARCSGFQPEEILELWMDAKIAERTAQK